MKPEHMEGNELSNTSAVINGWEDEWTQNNPETWSNDEIEALGAFGNSKGWDMEVIPLGCKHS